jgi:hypothetical protein
MVAVAPVSEEKPILLDIVLPRTGRNRWPVEDVIALDEAGSPIPLTRDGIEWGRLQIAFPPAGGVRFIRTAGPSQPEVAFPERERIISDPGTGLTATICPWFGGKRAALSLRFDDSHPSHLKKVIPLLRRYGFKGTFMINPGTPDYIEHQEEWEAVAKEGDQEFANHTLHHRGADSDREAEREIGEVSRYIWSLFPNKSPLVALNLGGGTKWTTTKPLRYFLDKYHLFFVPGSLGMDEVYGERVQAFRRHLSRHIERGLWCRVHFHSVGEGMSTSEATFLAVLESIRKHEQALWIAGMSDIYKYQRERKAARLSLKKTGTGRFELRLQCGTDLRLYDQPLTIQVTLPAGWLPDEVVVEDKESKPIRTDRSLADERVLLRFDVVPADAMYIIRRVPLEAIRPDGSEEHALDVGATYDDP